MNPANLRTACYALFFLSGFSALVFESMASQYLRLYLGHAAYAQALVLAAFMGGMSLGAWLAARNIRRISNPIRAYAIVEGLIGLMAVAFHSLFGILGGYTLNHLVPAAGSAMVAGMMTWGTGLALILPQSILLGMTFPLLANGLMRAWPGDSSGTLGRLYFSNSLGGAIGVLVSGFVLIALVGLPGTMLTAGLINSALAIAAYAIARRIDQPIRPQAGASSETRLSQIVLLAALITGLSSFIYEIIWIRMLSMVLGSSTHAFELMLSAFITGLALGGYWIRKRPAGGSQALVLAGGIQILMGVAAFLTVPLYNVAFDAMAFFLNAFARSGPGYLMFNVSSHFIALAVMLPTTILAGMTLPLFTGILLARGHGEKSVGQVYAYNTAGAIAGALLALFVLMPGLGIEGGMFVGSSLDILVGGGLLVAAGKPVLSGIFVRTRYALLALACITLVLVTQGPDPRRMASGVFNSASATLPRDVELLAHYDGNTASVSVMHRDGITSILTNGKPDASAVTDGKPGQTVDEDTMVLLGAMPLAIKSDATEVADIGLGSGITTHTLLSSPQVQRVDTVEIERFIEAGARYFRHRSERAFTDARSNVYFEDARTFFQLRNRKYDIIVSEPSNPWVSGITSLFSTEFYAAIQRHLESGGLFVQWIHIYQSDRALVESILKAMAANFQDFHVYAGSDLDLLVVASACCTIPLPGSGVFAWPLMNEDLAQIQIASVADLQQRFLADKSMLLPALAESGVPANSDYFPFVDLNAAQARFNRQSMQGLHAMRLIPVPVLLPFRPELYGSAARPVHAGKRQSIRLVTEAESLVAGGTAGVITDHTAATRPYLGLLDAYHSACPGEMDIYAWEQAYLNVMAGTVAFLAADDLETLWSRILPACAGRFGELQNAMTGMFAGYARRDMGRIAANAAILLAQGARYTTSQREFLLGSLLMGAVGRSEHSAALTAWTHFAPGIYVDLERDVPYPLQLLLSRARAGMQY